MTILDDAHDFLADHIAATPEQIDAMTLHDFATHAISYGVTFPRVLFTSNEAESGKTHAMMVNVSLCANPMDTSGTSYAFQSGLMEATNEPEKPTPTLYRDEISDVFGKAGLSGNNNPIAEILRKGYKRGATRSASVNRVKTEYNIFTPFLMTGLRTAVPTDIRTRCIVLTMTPGKPRKYYDVRESEPYARSLNSAIAATVKAHKAELTRFRARGIHPKLVNRKLEIWEPLFAVAYVLGGQAWLNRATRAFAAIALDESDVIPLTPRQIVTRDVAGVAALSDERFITSGQLTDELLRSDEPLYDGRTEHSLACLIRDTVDARSGKVTMNGQQVRAYRTADLLAAWEAIKPAELDDVDMPDEIDDLSDCEDWDSEAL
jgi:hypothetical protein